MSEPARIVVGGSVAALVAADELAAAGERVRLLLPERGVGAGFAGRVTDGRVLDFGIRLLELGYEDVGDQPDLTDYNPTHAGHRPYIALIDQWCQALMGDRIIEAPRPQMFFDGRLVDDLYFTTDLSVLPDLLDPAELATIAGETATALARLGSDAGVLDARTGPDLWTLGLESASVSNHGPHFHARFMAPIADKFAGAEGATALTSLRRRLWLPLFWPRTLQDVCIGAEPSFRPARPFHTVTPSGVTGLVDALRERLVARGVSLETAGSLTAIRPTGTDATQLEFSGLDPVTAHHPIIGVSPTELFAAAGITYRPTSARSVLAWIEVPQEQVRLAPSLVTVVDAGLPAVRVSTGGVGRPGTQLFTVELRHDLPEADIADAARKTLTDLGLVVDGYDATVVGAVAGPGWTLPSRANVTDFTAARQEFDAHGFDLDVVGGAAAFAADSFNEQIIQGLRAAKVTTQCHS